MPPFLSKAREIARLAAAGCPVLMWHKVAPIPWRARARALYVPPGMFRRLTRSLASLPARTPPEAASGQPGGVCLTFDDGFAHLLGHALPALVAHKLTAIVFLVAGRLGGHNDWETREGEVREELLDAAQVREWLAAGQRIGAHSLTHPRLTRLAEADAREEVVGSRRRLEDAFGVPVTDFAYPYGDHDARVRALVAEAGYHTAATVEPALPTPGGDHLAMPRFLVRWRRGNPLKALAARWLGRRPGVFPAAGTNP